jgi:hypothetical protein
MASFRPAPRCCRTSAAQPAAEILEWDPRKGHAMFFASGNCESAPHFLGANLLIMNLERIKPPDEFDN